MPASRRQIDPKRSALEAFAHDLRALGVGRASVPHMAKHSPDVSRAALYAALSGRRVPSPKTLSTLLRWWLGGRDAFRENGEEGDYWEEDSSWGPEWAWLDLLTTDHRNWSSILGWMHRRAALADERRPALTAEPVAIPTPPEQDLFIEELRRALQNGGLLDTHLPASHWEDRRADSRQEQRLQRYLNGERIPIDESLERLLWGLVSEREIERLLALAEAARGARVRDRRAARHARSHGSSG